MILPNSISITATTMAKSAAFQNPETSNLDPMMESLNIIIRMVMMKETKPKVSQLSGKVNSRNMPPTMAFTKPMTKPVTIAHPKPATCTPGIT